MPLSNDYLAIRALPFKPPKLRRFLREPLDSHYEDRYGGAVRRLNKALADAGPGEIPAEDLSRVLLSELLFESLTDSEVSEPSPELQAALTKVFGSDDAWRAAFHAQANAVSSAGGESGGWLAFLWSPRLRQFLFMHVPDGNIPPATDIILVFYFDANVLANEFNADARAYVDAYLANINWHVVNRRFAAATTYGEAKKNDALVAATNEPTTAVEELAIELQSSAAIQVLDVRQHDDVDSDRIAGSIWRDPEAVETWIDEIPTDRPVVVYCVYGGWVSADTASALRRRGVDARVLRGGISSWRALDLPVEAVRASSDER